VAGAQRSHAPQPTTRTRKPTHPMISGLDAYIAYFRNLAADHVAVNDFVYGSAERVVRRSAATLSYPIVWLAMPEVAITPEGNEQFSGALFFLSNAINEEGTEDDAMRLMYEVGRDFHQRMRQDANTGEFGYGATDVVLMPKPRITGDNDWGYAMDFDLILGSSGCYNPAKFGQ
jgi:hypothetical protein